MFIRPDYKLKALLLDSGFVKLKKRYDHFCYLFNLCYFDDDKTYLGLSNDASLELLDQKIKECEDEALDYFNVDLNNHLDPLVRECMKIIRANVMRVQRLKKRINSMLELPCIFITLTFDNDSLDSLNDDTKRRMVARTLKSLGCKYIANVDYGAENGRIHYHAIAQIERMPFGVWGYGNIDVEKIVVKNGAAISKYISKLTNHAIKKTAKGNRLIYSRGV